MKIKYLIAVACLAAVVALAAVLSGTAGRKGTADRASETNETSSAVRKGRAARQRAADQQAHGGTNASQRAASKRIDLATVNPDELDDKLLKKTIEDLKKMLKDETDERYKRVRKMQRLLDEGNQTAALYDARELRFSNDKVERFAAVEVFGWIGSKALPEITEMLSDPELEIANEAWEKWEMAFNELESDDFRREVILEAAKTFDDENKLYPILWKLLEMGGELAKSTLQHISEGGGFTDAAKYVAEDLYGHRYGEVVVDPALWNDTMKRLQAQRDAELKAQAAAEAQEAQNQINEGESP